MKVVLITILFVGFSSYLVHHGLRNKTRSIEQEVSEMTLKSEALESQTKTRKKQERAQRMATMRSAGKSKNSPFVEKMKEDLEKEVGLNNTSSFDYLHKLRTLSIDEVKMLNQQLLDRYRAPHSYALREASNLILLDADPLYLIQDDDLRQHSHDLWAKRTSSAFQSLLRKDPSEAKTYFQSISLADLQSNNWPFSKIYTQMMGHFLKHDPEEAIKYYYLQKENIRNLPGAGTRGKFSSMNQVMPYAELLKSTHSNNLSSLSLLFRIGREADRLGGFKELERFSRAWAGPEKSEEEQLKLLFSTQQPITSPERANEFLEFLSRSTSSTRFSYYNNLVKHWKMTDLKGASKWVKDQPASTERDLIIGNLMRGLDWADPAAAEEWIPFLHDEKQRSKHLEAIEEREAPYRN